MSIQTVRVLYAAGLTKDAVDQLLALDTAATAAQTAADAAQTTADNSANSSAYAKIAPSGIMWSSDTAGVFPGDPGTTSEDVLFTFYDKDDTAIATRVLRGTLTSGTGNIAVTNISSSGLTTSYALVDDGTTSVLANVTVTLSDGSMFTASAAWSSVDISGAATTPVTGAGK